MSPLRTSPGGPCGIEEWLPELQVPQAKVAEAQKGEAACPAPLFPGIVSVTMPPLKCIPVLQVHLTGDLLFSCFRGVCVLHGALLVFPSLAWSASRTMLS